MSQILKKLKPKNMKTFVAIGLLSLLTCSLGAPGAELPSRIVGGVPASPGEFPYQVSFQYLAGHMCGGSIVTEKHIVTAAHCCTAGGGDKNRFRVVAGEHILSRQEGPEQIAQIETITLHPDYKDVGAAPNDICVLTLSSNLNFTSPFVRPIELAAPTDEPQGDSVVVGWGHEVEGGKISDILRKVTVPLITNAKCGQQYPGRIVNSMICAGADAGGIDSCQNDSGGPLTAFVGGKTKLVGVVSWGSGCARPGFAGVYTRVSSFNAWVNSVIRTL